MPDSVHQTIKPPDNQQALESPAPVVTKFRRFIEENETWETPFVWSISDAAQLGASTRTFTLRIKNETHHPHDWSASNANKFRIIFELWIWQTDTNAFEFGWIAGGGHRVAWLHVWFNMTNPSRT